MNTPDLTSAPWHISTYSGQGASCVEVAALPDTVAARDSKNRTGPVLTFTPEGWDSFIRAVNDGEFQP